MNMETLEQITGYLKLGIYIAEWLAALIGFWQWKHLNPPYWRWFPVYLLLIAIAETMNHHFGANSPWMTSILFPYFIIPLEFIFFGWLFSRQPGQLRYSLLYGFFLLLYLLSLAAEPVFFSGESYWFQSFSYCVGNLLLLILIIRYLIYFVLSKELLHYKRNSMFWICTGLFIFYLGSFPFFGLGNTLYKDDMKMAYEMYIGVCIFCIIMYLLFAVSFLCHRKK
jgi:hypothetical protein